MVLYKQSYLPDCDCICYFSLRRGQDANVVFHQSCSAEPILRDNTLASALDRVITCTGEVLFERKPPTLTKPEATLGDSDLRISGQLEEP